MINQRKLLFITSIKKHIHNLYTPTNFKIHKKLINPSFFDMKSEGFIFKVLKGVKY